ncbi:hypothetical protein Tco_0524029 [Tanacetum coccineum]
MLNSSTGLFSFQFSSTDGLNSKLENGPWFIRNHPLILRKWNPDVDLLKKDVGNMPVWVKLHGVPITAFSEDGLSVIATKLAMIELRADVELKDTIVVAMPKIIREGYYTFIVRVEYEWKPPGSDCGILTRQPANPNPTRIATSSFKPHKEYQRVPKKPIANSSGNKKKGVVPTNEVSNSNPFDVLNLVDNDVELGTNKGTTNLVNNGANSSGPSFMNVKNSSTCTTPIIDKIKKFKDLLISGQAILVDKNGNPLKKVECLGDYDSEMRLHQLIMIWLVLWLQKG